MSIGAQLTAFAAAGFLILSAAGAPAGEPSSAPAEPDASALIGCASAEDLALCLRPVIEGSQAGARSLGAVRLLGPAASWAPPGRPDVLASVLAADRRGDLPAQSLAPVTTLGVADQAAILEWLCSQAAPTASAEGPAYRAWSAVSAPSRPLLAAAAGQLAGLGGDDGTVESRDALAIARMRCFGALGDGAAVLQSSGPVDAGAANDLLALVAISYGRLDEAASLVEAGDGVTRRPAVGPITGVGRSAAEQLLHAGIAARRPDIADRAARVIVERAELRGLAPALGWLVRRPGREALAPRLADLARQVRPGGAAWNWGAAVAIHRALLAIGDAAAAKAYETEIWRGAPGRPDGVDTYALRAALLTDDGRWDEAAAQERQARAASGESGPYAGFGALGVNRLAMDLDFGEAEARLPLHLAHAVSPISRVELLAYCATLPGGFARIPLDIGAGCARQLAPLLSATPSLKVNPDAANAFFMVAWSAARADRLDLAREMLAAGLRYCPPDQMSSKLGVIFEVVAIDLHARGKL